MEVPVAPGPPDPYAGLEKPVRWHGAFYQALKGWGIFVFAAAGFGVGLAIGFSMDIVDDGCYSYQGSNSYYGGSYVYDEACSLARWPITLGFGLLAAPFAALAFAGLAAAGSWLFGSSGRALKKEATQKLAQARDWFVQGMIMEPEFVQLQTALDAIRRGRVSAPRHAARTTLWSATLCTLGALAALTFSFLGFWFGVAGEGTESYHIGYVTAPSAVGLTAWSAVLWRAGGRSMRAAVRLEYSNQQVAQQAEMAMLSQANARARGAAPLRQAARGGPAFAPYAGSGAPAGEPQRGMGVVEPAHLGIHQPGASAGVEDLGFGRVAQSLGIDDPQRRRRRKS